MKRWSGQSVFLWTQKMNEACERHRFSAGNAALSQYLAIVVATMAKIWLIMPDSCLESVFSRAIDGGDYGLAHSIGGSGELLRRRGNYYHVGSNGSSRAGRRRQSTAQHTQHTAHTKHTHRHTKQIAGHSTIPEGGTLDHITYHTTLKLVLHRFLVQKWGSK